MKCFPTDGSLPSSRWLEVLSNSSVTHFPFYLSCLSPGIHKTLGESIQNLAPMLDSELVKLGGQVVPSALSNWAHVHRSRNTLTEPDARILMVDEKIVMQLLVMAVALDRSRIPSELCKFIFRPIDFEGGQDRLRE